MLQVLFRHVWFKKASVTEGALFNSFSDFLQPRHNLLEELRFTFWFGAKRRANRTKVAWFNMSS